MMEKTLRLELFSLAQSLSDTHSVAWSYGCAGCMRLCLARGLKGGCALFTYRCPLHQC